MGRVRKDSTGPDLKQIFIQSEGTLGIITKVGVLLTPSIKYKKVSFMDFNSYDDLLEVAAMVRKIAGRNLAAIEYLDHESYKIVHDKMSGFLDFPFKVDLDKDEKKWYMLVEIEDNDDEERPLEILSKISEVMEENSKLNEMILGDSLSQIKNLWDIRENVAVACCESGLSLKYDLSLDISKFQELVDKTREKAGD